MADNEQNKKNSDSDSQVNPMKSVKTTSLPVKHEFSSYNSKKNGEKRNEN